MWSPDAFGERQGWGLVWGAQEELMGGGGTIF